MTEEGWIRVGEASSWVRGRGRRVDVAGQPVAVFWDGAVWTALDDTCPHMGASLADGRLVDHEVQCSWHEWRYDLTTGRCPVRPWAVVRVHPIRVEDGAVWVKQPDPPSPPAAPPEDEPDWLDWPADRYFKKR